MHIVVSFETGGMENGIVNLACRLPSSEFEISICCLEKSGKSAGRLPKNVQVFELNKKPGVSFSTPLKLARLIKQVRPHLLHTHGLGPLLYGAAATFIGPSVPILHGEHRELYGHDLTRRSMVMRKTLYRRCACIHTVSKSLKEHLAEFGFDSQKITAIPNGVDCAKFRPDDKTAAKAMFNLSPGALALGVVSRIRPEKNIDLLVSAFAEMSSAFENCHALGTPGSSLASSTTVESCHALGTPGSSLASSTTVENCHALGTPGSSLASSTIALPGWSLAFPGKPLPQVPHERLQLLIVGDGPALPALRSKIAGLGVSDSVVLAGHRDDTPLCYNAMDLMILPSSAEGLSNSVLEAMACGVPVIVSHVCGSSEIVTHGHDGLLVEPGNKNALIKTITGAISDTASLKVMGENARKTVVEKFSLDVMVGQYKQVYQDLWTTHQL